jgi:intracellular sulfur oxidation DsrE/DsrF family protein
MSPDRRRLFGGLAALTAATGLSRPAAAAPGAGVPRVVYHLADLEKITFVLGNIENHFKGEGGPGKVHIALVVHGPALGGFRPGAATANIAKNLTLLAKMGVDLGACGNTLDAQKWTVADLLPGFSRIDEGGVVRLARLQAEGYAYIRP